MSASLWIITYTPRGKTPVSVIHAHNAVADYRSFGMDATSKEVTSADLLALIESHRALLSLHLHGNGHAAQREILDWASALRDRLSGCMAEVTE